jgi:hypothetical protein
MIFLVFKVYEKAQMGMVRPVHTEKVDLDAMYTEGDRTGHVHIGYNQTLFIGMLYSLVNKAKISS